MKEKNNKLMLCLIIILSLLVVGLGGYLVYEKVIAKDGNKGEEKEELEDKKTVDLTLVNELFDKYGFHTELTDDTKMFIALNNIESALVSTSSCDTLYSNTIEKNYGEYYVTLEVSNGRVNSGSCADSAKTYAYLNVNYVYKELFGTEMPKKDFIYANGMSYNIYDYKDDNFIELNFNGGGYNPTRTLVGIKDAKIENGKLIVNVGSILLESDTDDYMSDNFDSYVVSSDKTIKYARDKVDSSTGNREVVKDIVENHYDIMEKTKYVFEEKDDHYILANIEK